LPQRHILQENLPYATRTPRVGHHTRFIGRASQELVPKQTHEDQTHAVDKGLVIPLENPGLPKFSRMPINYFMSLPTSPVKPMTSRPGNV